MLKGILIYAGSLVLGSRAKREREPDSVPCLRYFGAALMMGLWGVLWLGFAQMHSSSPYPPGVLFEYCDPLYEFPKNWQIPLLMAAISFCGVALFSRWTIKLEQDRLIFRHWPFAVKTYDMTQLLAIERYRFGYGAKLYFKGDVTLKINTFMSGQQHFLDAVSEHSKNRRSRNRSPEN